MAVYRRGQTWWIEFNYAGKRIRESAKTTRKTMAVEYEKKRRRELEENWTGHAKRPTRLLSVSEVVAAYSASYELGHRPKAVAWSRERLAHVERLLGTKLLADLTDGTVQGYMRKRNAEGVSGGTINMELQELSRAIGKPWRMLWPDVRKLEENHHVGVALSEEEEERLLAAADDSRSPVIAAYMRIALLTAMRAGEIRTLQWGRIDLAKRTITVGRAKTKAGTGRVIPMSADLFDVICAHAEWFTKLFGETKPEYFLFPYGEKRPNDPTRPTLSVRKAWGTVRSVAGVNCRFHDLRHTALTKMAEAGVPEGVMMALAGHLSRAMLERYSHVRMEAKRRAVDAMQAARKPVSDALPTDSPTIRESGRLQ